MLLKVRCLFLLALVSLPAAARAATIRHDASTGAFPSTDMRDYWHDHVLSGGGQGPFTGYVGNNWDQWFLDTFTLPGGITAATLEIQVRAIAGGSGNDALHLQIWTAGEYETFLDVLYPPLPWGRDLNPITFTFDLATLPGMIASMNNRRELRVSVQDDTEVIYAQLTFTPEPSTFVLFALGTAAAVTTGLRRRARAAG